MDEKKRGFVAGLLLQFGAAAASKILVLLSLQRVCGSVCGMEEKGQTCKHS